MELIFCKFPIVKPASEPWYERQLGISDKPLPPFKEIIAQPNALEFLMQRYEYQSRALPSSIKSESHELLAAPVTLKLNGTDLADGVVRTVTLHRPNRIEWRGENSFARWEAWTEEDGFAWYTVTLKKKNGFTAESLLLDIPVKKEFASFLSPFPFFRSGGDMDGRYCYDFKPWVSMDFKQILTLRNDDRGIELVAEDPRGFSRKTPSGYQRLMPQDDRVIIRMTIIDQPVPLDRELTYSFGIQAFPAKPFQLQPDSFANANYVDPRSAAWSGGKDKVLFSLKLPETLPAGTIELSHYWDFEPNWVHPDYHVHEYLIQHLISLDSYALRWDAANGGFILKTGQTVLTSSEKAPKVDKGWHQLALLLEKNTLCVYLDKKLAAIFNGLALDAGFKNIVLGKAVNGQHADFHYEALKVSSLILKPERLGQFKRDDTTILLQYFKNKDHAQYRISGTPRLVKTDRGEFLSAAAEHFTRLDAKQSVGMKTALGYLGRIFSFYGEKPWGYRTLPYTNEEGYKAYGILVDDLKQRGMKLYFGYSFGLRIHSREDQLYRDYYSIHPARLYGSDQSGFYCMCTGCRDYSNCMLYYFNDLMKRYDNLSIYTDNLFVSGRECSNQSHGCGYIDQNGTLQMSGNMLKGREFAKRVYAICKLQESQREHYLHSSGCNHAMFMSWADKYLCGEQYLENTTQKDWNIDLGQYRAQNVSTCFGVPAVSISTFVPFGLKGMVAVAGLHNCATSGADHHRYPDDLFDLAPFLKVTGDFAVHNAEFFPYYRNEIFVRTEQEKRQYCSFWKKPGKALFIVSNLTWSPSQTVIEFDFHKLGLQGKVLDALEGKALKSLGNGKFSLEIPAYEARYVVVE